MVWRYTEYAKCPQITDWVGKQFKFGITLDVDVTEIIPRPIIYPDGNILTRLEFKTNDTLRPRYYMRIGENRNSILNLEFDNLLGLKRRMYTNEGVVEFSGVEYQSIKPQLVDTGNFYDFKVIGEYAVKRFPKISKEIDLSPDNFLTDIPEDELNKIIEYTESCHSFPSWEVIQRDLSKDFYQNYELYIIFENINNKIEKRANPFSKEERKTLLEIIEPLKP